MKFLWQRWNRFWFEPATADNLGLCRIILYGSMFLFYVLTPVLFSSWGWHEDFALWGNVSRVFWNPVWLIATLHLPPLPTTYLVAIQFIWRLALALSCVGLLTRASTAVSFVLGVYLMGLPNSFGRTHHLDQLLIWAFLVMAFSRCGDAWSVDALIRKARAQATPAQKDPTPSAEYTWPVHLIWVVSAMVYLEAGLSKLRHSGTSWVTTDIMRNFLMRAYYHVSDSEPLTSWGLVIAKSYRLSSALAAGALILEVGFVIAVFSRRSRWVLVPGVMTMQTGIAVLMGPNFYQMIICQLLWVPWDRVVRWLEARYEGGKTYAVAFDGACGFCRRTIVVLRSLDLLNRVEFMDAVHEWPRIEEKFPHLDRDHCLIEMHACTPQGQTATGFYAYRMLAWALPVGWLALPFLYLPGVGWAGSAIYGAVASRRHRGVCEVPLAPPVPESQLPHTPKAPNTH